MSERVVIKGAHAHHHYEAPEPLSMSVVIGIQRPSSKAVEWDAENRLYPYSYDTILSGEQTETEIQLTTDQAARLEEFYRRFYADWKESTGPGETIDCHSFLDYVAFNRDLGARAISIAANAATIENDMPYRLMGGNSDRQLPVHSFFTTSNAPETLSVFGAGAPLVTAALDDIRRYGYNYGGTDTLAHAVDSEEPAHVSATFYRR